ncbi:MAG: hypothetical protein ACJAX4_002496 [Clostridium sp.]|jgi:hypothetical protein
MTTKKLIQLIFRSHFCLVDIKLILVLVALTFIRTAATTTAFIIFGVTINFSKSKYYNTCKN